MSPIAPVFFVYFGIMLWLFQRRTQWLTWRSVDRWSPPSKSLVRLGD